MRLMRTESEGASEQLGKPIGRTPPPHRSLFYPSSVQLTGLVLLVLAGVIQAWWTRHLIFSDGISYLDIADSYARGDWHHALNEYWSPLLPWLLAIVFRLFHPSTYWQVSTLHVINLLI